MDTAANHVTIPPIVWLEQNCKMLAREFQQIARFSSIITNRRHHSIMHIGRLNDQSNRVQQRCCMFLLLDRICNLR
jgi:hypothetical protein